MARPKELAQRLDLLNVIPGGLSVIGTLRRATIDVVRGEGQGQVDEFSGRLLAALVICLMRPTGVSSYLIAALTVG